MAQTLNISMTPGLPMPVFNVSQYDTGQSLTVNLQGYTIPSESTITILGTKPSGFGFSVACTYEGSSVTVPVQSTMTEEAGRIPVELRVVKGNKIRGSANFILKVEESPHKENVTDGDAVTAQALGERIDALEDEVDALDAAKVDATGVTAGYVPTADGQDGWSWEAQSGGGGSGLTDGIKQALLQIASKVAYIDENGQDYYDALEDALYPPAPPATLVSIDAVYVQSGTVYTTATLDSLKPDLTVTAHYDDSSSQVVNAYTLSGTLVAGENTITVSYSGKTDTFTVTATEYSTAPVIVTEGVCWSKTAPDTVAKEGFGITKWYEYEFTQEALEACTYWDATNQYMTTGGWSGIKYYIADPLTLAAGYTWPASANFKNVAGKDGVYVNNNSITKNALTNWQFIRQSTAMVQDNGLSFTIPLLDKDDCYAYWYKPTTNSILPTGVSDGDIIFAGANTPYYGMHNISEAES